MKKILFFAILFTIIFYGMFSNYAKKKEMKPGNLLDKISTNISEN